MLPLWGPGGSLGSLRGNIGDIGGLLALWGHVAG